MKGYQMPIVQTDQMKRSTSKISDWNSFSKFRNEQVVHSDWALSRDDPQKLVDSNVFVRFAASLDR